MVYVTLKEGFKLTEKEKHILEKELRNFYSEVDFDLWEVEDGIVECKTYKEFEMGRFDVSLKIKFHVRVDFEYSTYWEPGYTDVSDPIIDDVEVDEIYEYDEDGDADYIEDEEREKAVIKAIEKAIDNILR